MFSLAWNYLKKRSFIYCRSKRLVLQRFLDYWSVSELGICRNWRILQEKTSTCRRVQTNTGDCGKSGLYFVKCTVGFRSFVQLQYSVPPFCSEPGNQNLHAYSSIQVSNKQWCSPDKSCTEQTNTNLSMSLEFFQGHRTKTVASTHGCHEPLPGKKSHSSGIPNCRCFLSRAFCRKAGNSLFETFGPQCSTRRNLLHWKEKYHIFWFVFHWMSV